MALNKTMTFDLELKPGGIPPIVHASQGDIGRMFKANIYWDGSAATSYISGATVNLRGRKPDKTVFDYSATLAGSMVTFETTEQMTIISGPVECELVFSNDGDIIASANFLLIVEASPYDPDALSESDVEGLTDVLESFQRLNRDSNGVVKIGDGVTASGTAEPIKGFYVHDEVTDTDGVAKYDYDALENAPNIDGYVEKGGIGQVKPQNIDGVAVTGGSVLDNATRLYATAGSSTDGYINISGGYGIIQSTSGFCSFYIPVKKNTRYTANHSIRFLAFFENFHAVESTGNQRYGDLLSASLTSNVTTFETGNADGVVVSWSYNTYPIETTVISEGATATDEITAELPAWWGVAELETKTDALEVLSPWLGTLEKSEIGSIPDGGGLQLYDTRNNLRKGERIVFEGNITTFDSLTIGLTYNDGVANAVILNAVTIDSDNISYKASDSATAQTVPHGLTIANNVQIIWEMGATANLIFTLVSNGEIFKHEFTNFARQAIGGAIIRSSGSSLTDCKLAWTCKDLSKKIWFFGDSYLSYRPARWTYYLHEYGYDENVLLDGFAGESGVNGRVSFANLLTFSRPKYAVWCLGMNDRADSDTEPSSNWVSARDVFLTLCNNNGVTPVFATIPTVPNINHEQKNTWVRSSGYRYIDFAKAVGANGTGAWFSGMLSSDNVHPTEQGAKALFARVLLDLPEIMVCD